MISPASLRGEASRPAKRTIGLEPAVHIATELTSMNDEQRRRIFHKFLAAKSLTSASHKRHVPCLRQLGWFY